MAAIDGVRRRGPARLTRAKAAHLLFADRGELDRLIQEAELPEEFLARYEGGLDGTADPDFSELVEHCQFIALDESLLCGTSDPELESGAASRYRSNFCQRLTGGVLVRIAVMRRSAELSRVRSEDQRKLVEWLNRLRLAVDSNTNPDTRNSVRATVIILFDRPLERGDAQFLRTLRVMDFVRSIYVVTERFRVTGDGRGLVHSRYVWPKMVAMLLARLASEAPPLERRSDGAPIIAWRCFALGSGTDARVRRQPLVDVSRDFKGDERRRVSVVEDVADGAEEHWIRPFDAVHDDMPEEAPDIRAAGLLGDAAWRLHFSSARGGFHESRITSESATATRTETQRERAFWTEVGKNPCKIWESTDLADDLDTVARLSTQRAGVRAAELQMREAERGASVATLAAEHWRRADDACVAPGYRLIAAGAACAMLALPAWQLLSWIREQSMGDAAQPPSRGLPWVAISALVALLVGSLLAAWLSWFVERRILDGARDAHTELLRKAIESRGTAFQTAGRLLQYADDLRARLLRRRSLEHRKRLVERAQRVVDLGLRDARIDVDVEEGGSFLGIAPDERKLAREDLSEFMAGAWEPLDRPGGERSPRSEAAAGTADRDAVHDVADSVPEDNADRVEAATGLRRDWQAEVPRWDSRAVGRLPARALRLLVARLARRYRFIEMERSEGRLRDSLLKNEPFQETAATRLSEFLASELVSVGSKFRFPLLSVEAVGGGAPNRLVSIVAADEQAAESICNKLKAKVDKFTSRLSFVDAKAPLFQIGAAVLCIDEYEVMLASSDDHGQPYFRYVEADGGGSHAADDLASKDSSSAEERDTP